MNQQQREFLIKQVDAEFRRKIEELEKQIEDFPSLNNYIVAAFLDGTIQFQEVQPLRDKIRERVLKLGTSETLVKPRESRQRRWDYDGKAAGPEDWDVEIRAHEIFVLPKAYMEAWERGVAKKKLIEDQVAALRAKWKTIELKLQVGSPKALESLIDQVDKIGDLTLIDNTLQLGGEELPRQIEPSKKAGK